MVALLGCMGGLMGNRFAAIALFFVAISLIRESELKRKTCLSRIFIAVVGLLAGIFNHLIFASTPVFDRR
jgi:hypothetical protein